MYSGVFKLQMKSEKKLSVGSTILASSSLILLTSFIHAL